MDMEIIYRQLTNLLREILGDDSIEIDPDTVASDINGWDSFNHLSILVAVETLFRIRFGTREIDNLRTVGDLARVIAARAAH